ncbi:MAG TPA: TetR/AcrR family transcriptional regulator [Solirubrobacteraceae bacterium]|jgi:AcrR family transcriptional regulator|nr:TetR/AcrR family transcriptional regulator [Solirubrobacteraceae bacterium]
MPTTMTSSSHRGGSASGKSMAASPPVGGRGPGRQRVIEIQRARILAAMTELVRERGVSRISVAHIVARSGVSRRTFYELFADREACLLAAFEHALERAAAVVLPAYEGTVGRAGAPRKSRGAKSRTGERPRMDHGGAGGGDDWEARIRAGLAALLAFLDEEPGLGRLLVVDTLAADRVVLERRARAVEVLIDAVNQGAARPHGGPGRPPPRLVAEGAIGAVLAVIHARLREPGPKPLTGLQGQLMGMIVLPYRGAEAAERELRHRVPRPRRRPAAATVPDPLRELDMRLTYRTVRVLLAIAELGGGRARGPSSREVAEASGISDQGQMSKLLWRLAHLGLIANGAECQGRGEPNAWRLTPTGREVQRAISEQMER